MRAQQGFLATAALAAALATAPSPAEAFVLPSFHLSSCAFRASHIVVVTEGSEIDGKVRVLESWLGDLKRGDELNVPGLKRFSSPMARMLLDNRSRIRRHRASGKRILLFLIRTSAGWDGAARERGRFAGMGVSCVWFEHGKGYGLTQVEMSGGQVFWPQGGETSIRGSVLSILAERRQLQRAKENQDADARTRVLQEMVRSPTHDTSRAAVAALASLGDAALPHLRESLRDERLPSHAIFSLLPSIEKIDREVAMKDAIALLESELAFCGKNTSTGGKGPVVRIGWDRLQRTEYLLNWMQNEKCAECVGVIERAVAFWNGHTDTHGYIGSLRGAATRALNAGKPK